MGKSDLLKDSMKSGLDGLRQKKSLLYIAILLLTRVFIRV